MVMCTIAFLSSTNVLAQRELNQQQKPVKEKSQSVGEDIRSSVRRALGSGDIDLVEVMEISKSTLYRAHVTPEVLEASWSTKLIIRRLGAEQINKVWIALKAASIQYDSDGSEIRRGIVFYSKASNGGKQERVCSMYFDQTGRYGRINNIGVSFGDDFFSIVKSTLLGTMK